MASSSSEPETEIMSLTNHSSEDALVLVETEDKNKAEIPASALTLQQQALALRREAEDLRQALEQSKQEKALAEIQKVDGWIDTLLIECNVNDELQVLQTVDQVMDRLVQDRYSAEQIHKIFARMRQLRPQTCRSNCSPLLQLLLEAVGQLDDLERTDNPNKRWSGRVETVLQKKLFALDWGIELDDEENVLDE